MQVPCLQGLSFFTKDYFGHIFNQITLSPYNITLHPSLMIFSPFTRGLFVLTKSISLNVACFSFLSFWDDFQSLPEAFNSYTWVSFLHIKWFFLTYSMIFFPRRKSVFRVKNFTTKRKRHEIPFDSSRPGSPVEKHRKDLLPMKVHTYIIFNSY